MKRYITFVLVAMSLVGLVACSNDNGIAAPDGEAQVALRFESSSMTRADEVVAGINDLNENLIKTIDCYFYHANADENTPAVWHQQFDFVDEDNDIAGKQSTATVTDILMPSDKITAIFGQGTKGKIYAIANYAGGDALPTSGENTTVAKLKDMVVTTAWLDNGAYKAQASFVMDSEMVEITKSDNTISGEVPLFRTAAKVELTITDVEEVVSSKTTNADGTQTTTWYVPAILDASDNPTGAYVTMYNARTKAGVGGAVQTYSKDSSLTLENYGFSKSTVAGALYKQTNPFYTYPHTWESSEQEASLLLVVYWQATDKESKEDTGFGTVGDAIPCYYEIPIGLADNTEILRNHIYQIGINVGTLGSFVKEDPVLLTPSYMVVDWGTGDISAKIKGQRYLVVDKKKIEIFNQTDCKVNYATSHTEGAMILSISKPVFSGIQKTTNTIYSYNTETQTATGSLNGFTLSCADGLLKVSHTLDNDNTKTDFDYVPYTIVVRIYHTDDDENFYEDVTFVQYPAMYVDYSPNSDYVHDNKVGNDADNTYKGFVYVNGGGNDYGGVHGLGGAANANPNMYIITTTSFADDKYVIGDPRVTKYDNILEDNGNNWSTTASAIYEGTPNRQLRYYYPTDNSNATEQMIAPKFRIASSYGVSTSGSYENRQRRCASYQEDGYPAGRWRMPTKAEMEYIVLLSTKGIIPKLFNVNGDSDGNDYWCAHGLAEPQTTGTVELTPGTTSGSYSVRCVYDDWYWGSDRVLTTDAQKQVFTWGDMPR